MGLLKFLFSVAVALLLLVLCLSAGPVAVEARPIRYGGAALAPPGVIRHSVRRRLNGPREASDDGSTYKYKAQVNGGAGHSCHSHDSHNPCMNP
jgi:hypothetical protein